MTGIYRGKEYVNLRTGEIVRVKDFGSSIIRFSNGDVVDVKKFLQEYKPYKTT